jgi:translation initiation factor 3 subunit M
MEESQQLNYMIVDGLLGDYVQEVSAYLDQLKGLEPGAEGGLEDATSKLMEDESPENQEETFKAIAEQSNLLNKAPEKEFESAYNLVLHILTFSSKLTEILPILLNNLTQQPPSFPNGSLMVLSVLTNLFNILPVRSPLRYQVFDAILDFANKSSNGHLLVNQLKHLPKWIEEWGVGDAEKQSIYFKVSQVLASLDSEASYNYLFDAVSCISPDAASGSVELTEKLVKLALVSDEIYDFDDILALSAVQKLKDNSADLYKLLEIVSSGDFNAFSSYNGKVSDVDMDAIVAKVKVLALANLAFQSSSTITYSSISSAIQVPEEEVELWVIDAIRAGLVEGRLCQMEQRFDIHRATPIGKFGEEEWKEVSARLDKWKSSLREVYDVIRNARENAQKEKTNKLKQQQQQQQPAVQQQVA